MRNITWSPLKSKRLKRTRGVSFEEIIKAELMDIIEHPKLERQKVMVFKHRGYLWAVPFVVEGEIIFLKTIYPSRKLMKKYLTEKKP